MKKKTLRSRSVSRPRSAHALDGRHHGEGVQHAVKRRAADAENLGRSQLVAIAPLQHGENVPAYDMIEPPRTQVNAFGGRCGRGRYGLRAHTSFIDKGRVKLRGSAQTKEEAAASPFRTTS